MATRELLVKIVGQDVDLQRALSRSQQNIRKFGKAASTIGSSLTRHVTAPVAALGATILVATNRSAEFADNIDKASIRTGLARDRLQELGFAAGQLGADFTGITKAVESLTRRIPQLEKDTGDTAAAWRTLGVSLRDSEGQLRGMDDLLPEVIGALGEMQNATERNATATKLFGRRAFELVPLFDAGAEGIDALTQRARELGLVVGDESVAALVEYKDAMSEVRQQLSAVAARITTALLPVTMAIVDLVQDRVVPAMQTFADWLGNISTETKKTVAIIAGVVAALGPLTLAIAGVAGMIALLLTPVGAIIAALVSLSTIAVTVARNWDVLTLQGTLAWTALKSAAFDAVDGILGVLEKLAGWVPGLGDKIRGLRADFDEFAEKSIAKSSERILELEAEVAAFEPAAKRMGSAVRELAGDDLPLLGAEVNDVTKAISGLTQQLEQAAVMNELLGAEFDHAQAQASAYESAVQALVAAGVDLEAVVGPHGETVRDLADRYLDLQLGIQGVTEAARRKKDLEEEGMRMTESLLTVQEAHAKTEAHLNELLEAKTITQETYNRAMEEATRVLNEAELRANEVKSALVDLGREGLDAVVAFAIGGKNAFADFARFAIRELVKIVIKLALVKAFSFVLGTGTGGGSSGGIGGILGGVLGARAGGGPVAAGRPYLVGERGPELVVPRQSATVIPNHALAGTGSGRSLALQVNVGDAKDPFSLARDAQWQKGLREAVLVAREQGFDI
jgi:hypothetical protein